MFCIKCGAENSGEAEFCWKCGKSIFTAKSAEGTSSDLAVNIDLPHFQQNSASPEFSAPHLIQNIAWEPRLCFVLNAGLRILGRLSFVGNAASQYSRLNPRKCLRRQSVCRPPQSHIPALSHNKKTPHSRRAAWSLLLAKKT